MTVRDFAGPLPTPGFGKQVSAAVLPPFVGTYSGELTKTTGVMPLGVARYAGKVTGVYLSANSTGRDNTAANVPRVSGEVFINDTTCLTTKPSIGYKSGEAPQQKTTFTEAADTCVVAGVVDHTANTVSPGDVLTWVLTYSGSSSATTKMNNVSILVEVTPT